MGQFGITEIINAVERVASMLNRWGVPTDGWCLLDGPAIKIVDHEFDSSPWRDHLNIYVREEMLPWIPKERELTLPPTGSSELRDVLNLARTGTILHLVPAARYYTAGFERQSICLPSGYCIEVATIRGCSQVWSYKSVEIVDAIGDYDGDSERVLAERITRLRAALARAPEGDTRDRLSLLSDGYLAIIAGRLAEAKQFFRSAAGPSW
jgi:hypothetical protein